MKIKLFHHFCNQNISWHWLGQLRSFTGFISHSQKLPWSLGVFIETIWLTYTFFHELKFHTNHHQSLVIIMLAPTYQEGSTPHIQSLYSCQKCNSPHMNWNGKSRWWYEQCIAVMQSNADFWWAIEMKNWEGFLLCKNLYTNNRGHQITF